MTSVDDRPGSGYIGAVGTSAMPLINPSNVPTKPFGSNANASPKKKNLRINEIGMIASHTTNELHKTK